MATLLESLYDYVVDVGKSIATSVKEKAQELWMTINDCGSLLKDWLKQQWPGLTNIVNYVSNKVKEVGHTEFTILVETKDRVWSKVGDSFALVAESLTSSITDTVSVVGDKISTISEELWVKIKEVTESLSDKIRDRIAILEESVVNISQSIKDTLTEEIVRFKQYLEFPEQLFVTMAEMSEERWQEAGSFFVKLIGRILAFATKDIELKEA